MAGAFARGKHAVAICDTCGFKGALKDLRHLYVRGVRLSTMACSSCWDKDHPQNFQGKYPVYDPQALRESRPDVPEAPVPPYNPPFIG